MYYKIQPEQIGRDNLNTCVPKWEFEFQKNKPVKAAIRTTFSTGVIALRICIRMSFYCYQPSLCMIFIYYEVGDKFYYLTLYYGCFLVDI